MADARLVFPATERNREPIAACLAQWLPEQGSVLEVASGSGEHAVWMARQCPGVYWQASDPDPLHVESIAAWIAHERLEAQMPPPVALDVLNIPWVLPDPVDHRLDAVIAINLIHIAPWVCCQALVAEAARRLVAGGDLILYGPFRRHGVHTSKSNEAFDRSLRERDPLWGVRDLEAVEQLAGDSGFTLAELMAMPANNLCLRFRR